MLPERRREAVLVDAVVVRQGRLGVRERPFEGSLVVERARHQLVRVDDRARDVLDGREAERLAEQRLRALVLPANLVHRRQPVQRAREHGFVRELARQVPRPDERRLRLRRRPPLGREHRAAEQLLDPELQVDPLGLTCDRRERVTRRGEMLDRLPRRAQLQRSRGRGVQVANSAPRLAPFEEVPRELRRDLVDAIGVGGLEPVSDTPVHARPLARRKPLLERLVDEVVREPVSGRDRPVGPLVVADRADERGVERDVAQAPLRFVLVHLRGGRSGRGRELRPGDAHRLEQPVRVGLERGAALLDQAPKRLRHAPGELVEVPRDDPGAALPGQRALVDPRLDELLHVERVAACPRVEQRRDLATGIRAVEMEGEERVCRRLRERAERDLRSRGS